MAKKYSWIMITVLVTVMIMGGCSAFSSYAPSSKFYGFPVPKSASIIKETAQSTVFKWNVVKPEFGFPQSYINNIEKAVWNKEKNDDNILVFKKYDHRIGICITDWGKFFVTSDE